MACGSGCLSYPCPECGAVRPPPAEGSRTPRLRRRWTEEELAYDGDPNPKRMGRLTPRQRDILFRITEDILGGLRTAAFDRGERAEGPGGPMNITSADMAALTFVNGRGIRLTVPELELLLEAAKALDPRRD